MNLQHTTLPLLAPRSTDWASGPLATNVLQINNFDAMDVWNYLKRETNPNKKWNLVRMSLENTTFTVICTMLYRLS